MQQLAPAGPNHSKFYHEGHEGHEGAKEALLWRVCASLSFGAGVQLRR
jgi:hypothetical protein